MDNITVLIILNIVLIIMFLTLVTQRSECECNNKNIEGMIDTTAGETIDVQPQIPLAQQGTEASKNIAALYNDKILVVDNLIVTGEMEVKGPATFDSEIHAKKMIQADDKIHVGDKIELNPHTNDYVRVHSDKRKSFMYMNKGGDFGNTKGWSINKDKTFYGNVKGNVKGNLIGKVNHGTPVLKGKLHTYGILGMSGVTGVDRQGGAYLRTFDTDVVRVANTAPQAEWSFL
jgi:hypothetical protein